MKFLTDEDYRIYRQSLLFVMIIAAGRLFPGRTIDVHQSVNRSTYCEFEDFIPAPEDIGRLYAAMGELVKEAHPLRTYKLPREQAIALIRKSGDDAEADKLMNTPKNEVKLFMDSGKYYSVYGSVTPHAGYLRDFEVIPFESGFLIRYPHPDIGGIRPFHSGKKILSTINEYRDWTEVIGINNVYELNRLIRTGKVNECINISEIMHERRFSAIADIIKNDILNKKIILITGPSSSGKTTAASRIKLHLRASGIRPELISLDDYYMGRSRTPVDATGKPNYEDIEAIDYKLFNQHLLRLLDGETADIPKFDFSTGEPSKESRKIKLDSGSVVLVEGIHALNEKLTVGVPSKCCFKIYCSALTVMCFDRYNPISPTDTRILRRMIRDNLFRKTAPEGTFDMWPDVQKGEVKNIFPYEEAADMIFNSSLAYEYAIYRKLAEPLLESVMHRREHADKAKRLSELLSYFEPIDDVYIPPTSILREFIGGSSINYE